jgi:ABC-type antimicrobial peptide transport system ATPase subunit
LGRFHDKRPTISEKLRVLLQNSKKKFEPTVTLYEIYELSLSQEVKVVADLRTHTIKKQFSMIGVNLEIVKEGARIS